MNQIARDYISANFHSDDRLATAATRVSAMQACKAMPQPNHLMETSPGKRQVIWRVEAFTKNQAEVMMREMVREFGADPACTDVSRVLRLPGFYNHKYAEPHPVTVRNMTDEVYRPDSFPHFAQEPQRIRGGSERRKAHARGGPFAIGTGLGICYTAPAARRRSGGSGCGDRALSHSTCRQGLSSGLCRAHSQERAPTPNRVSQTGEV